MAAVRENLNEKGLCNALNLFSQITRSPKVRGLQDWLDQLPIDITKDSASLHLPTSANKLCPQGRKVVDGGWSSPTVTSDASMQDEHISSGDEETFS